GGRRGDGPAGGSGAGGGGPAADAGPAPAAGGAGLHPEPVAERPDRPAGPGGPPGRGAVGLPYGVQPVRAGVPDRVVGHRGAGPRGLLWSGGGAAGGAGGRRPAGRGIKCEVCRYSTEKFSTDDSFCTKDKIFTALS